MFSSDPRKNVLNRLGNKENVHKSKSDSRVENLDYKHDVSKKPNSPHRLPKLETPPSSSEMYDVSHDLRRGKQEVVPPVLPHLLESQLPKNVKMIEDEVMGLQDHTTGLYSQILPNMYGQPAIVTSQPHPVYHVPVLPVYYAPTYPQAGVEQPLMWQNRFMNDKQNRRIQATSVKPRYLSRNEAAGVIQRNFRHWQSRKGPRDPCYRVSEDVCTDFIDQGVTALIKQAASSVYFKFITSTPTAIGTPTSRICDDIICEVVDSECRHVMKSKVKALIEENRTYTGEHGWLEYFVLTTIHPLLQIIVLEAIDECQYGDTLSSLITEVTDDMANSVIINVWQEIYMNHYRSTHKEMISRYAQQHLLDSLCLDHLLSSLTGNNLPFYFKNYTHQVLDGMIAGTLMNQFLAVETDREETKSNMGVRKYQEAIFADMALDVVLAELEAHLDEDSRDLLEIEQRIDQDIFVDDFKST